MSMLMTRSAAEAWGLDWPADAALMESDGRAGQRFVTWAEVLDRRRERQLEELERKRHVLPPAIQAVLRVGF